MRNIAGGRVFRPAMPSVFDSFFIAGFECSSHRRRDGLRLDLIHSTGHEGCVVEDYRACTELGIRTVRDGLRWHLIEQSPGNYEWSSWVPMLEGAADAGVQVIWDLCHYGYPDHLELGTDAFAQSFARFAAEAVRVHRSITGRPALICPMNEINFFAWAVNNGHFAWGKGAPTGWVKRHLVIAALAAVEAIRSADPECRIFWAEPLVHILPRNDEPEVAEAARLHRESQFESCDMLLGRLAPELGGGDHGADAIGLNYYPDNQWIKDGSTIPLGHHDYVPLSDLLVEAYERFRKPLFISETGCERSARPSWFHYVCSEVREAQSRGVPVQGICIYPVTSFPGWENMRHAEVGLFSTPHSDGTRRVYEPLARELERQQGLFEAKAAAPELFA
jgi:beta-glucosidase/6-phospho-beta-glucosidase/beta-galactosidase